MEHLGQCDAPDDPRTAAPAARTRDRSVVDVERAGARSLPQARLPALAADRAQPGADAQHRLAGDAEPRPPPTSVSCASTTPRSTRSTRRAARGTRGGSTAIRTAAGPIAYFSAEFALHQSLPIYAGGLGVLAGDHCKEASDLGVPLIGVGFMYPQGYFHQSVSPEGWQQEIYERLSGTTRRSSPRSRRTASRASSPCRSETAACSCRCGASGSAASSCTCSTPISRRTRPWDRELSARLYGGDRETRVQQEIILGIGGVRALKAMGSRRRPGTSTKDTRRSSSCSASAT